MPKFEGSIYTNEKGEGKVRNRIQMVAFLAKYPSADFTIEIRRLAEKKSTKMRGYYFAAIVPVFQQALRANGYSFTKEQTHEFIKQFSPVMHIDVKIAGMEGLTSGFRSFKDDDFTDSDFRQYIEDLIIFASEHFGVAISDPN